MEKKKAIWSIISVITMIISFVILILIGKLVYTEANEEKKVTTYEEFYSKAELREDQAAIGTNIALHQEIHAKGNTYYRYKLKTDCPHWQYEDRYVTEHPLPYVINEHSAVETKAAEIQILLNGEVLAEGQHFEVPILDLQEDEKDLSDYKKDLWRAAWKQYQTEYNTGSMFWIKLGAYIAVFIAINMFGLIVRAMKSEREELKQDGDKVQILCVQAPVTESDCVPYCFYMVRQGDYEQAISIIKQVKKEDYNWRVTDFHTVLFNKFVDKELNIASIGTRVLSENDRIDDKTFYVVV